MVQTLFIFEIIKNQNLSAQIYASDTIQKPFRNVQRVEEEQNKPGARVINVRFNVGNSLRDCINVPTLTNELNI